MADDRKLWSAHPSLSRDKFRGSGGSIPLPLAFRLMRFALHPGQRRWMASLRGFSLSRGNCESQPPHSDAATPDTPTSESVAVGGAQRKEHRTAAEEGLEVAVETRREAL